jgi:hypothetical protein
MKEKIDKKNSEKDDPSERNFGIFDLLKSFLFFKLYIKYLEF